MIYMKADYEPWWMFEGWEETICSRRVFDSEQEALRFCGELLVELRNKYPFEAMKKDCFYAFWTECEKDFCESCDEDLQLYHGVIFMKDGKPTPYLAADALRQ
ncbi:DUF1033 family protein [Sporosarcina beigongshangi]|uniref:DUF1033 family protein n=1 Tax=Sporosarcina beigongshangi TaxID=2782538 RepID=UPI002ACDE3A4|nr:DUF1033 family protein [Sporosarcina beigongshangi]